jgi:hypothetical protein
MIAKRAKPEEIIAKLREAEVRLSQGESVAIAAKSIGVHTASFMVDLLASRVSPTATNLIDAGADAGSRSVSSRDRPPRPTRAVWS